MSESKYTFRYRKIIAEIGDNEVEAIIHKITSPCLSPMEVDPRKGAVVFFRSDKFQTDHSELPLKPQDYTQIRDWIAALKKAGTGVLPVSALSRDEDGEKKYRFVVTNSVPDYQNETVENVAVWLPTKAFKSELMCNKGNALPTDGQEKLDYRIRRVNLFLDRFAEWVNGENYSLTLLVYDKSKGEEKKVLENMFLGSGYEFCSEIARSYISLTVRQQQGGGNFIPDTLESQE